MKKLFIPCCLFLSLLITFFSCKKTDSVNDGPMPLVNRFFTVPPGASNEIKLVAKALEKQNNQYHYLSSITKRAGYPRWDKAVIANFDKGTITARGSEEASGEIVYIPFVKDSDNYVNSLLTVKMDAADTIYRMLYAFNYRAFGYDTSDHDKWNARDVFNIFTSFDHSVFGHTKFWVRDTNLFKPKNDSSHVIVTRINDANSRSTARASVYTLQTCGTVTVCSNPGPAPAPAPSPKPALARLTDDCSTVEICTTFYYGGGSDGTGSTGEWTGTGDGTGGGGSGGTGWYGEPIGSVTCASAAIQRSYFIEPTGGCPSGWVPVIEDNTAEFNYPHPGDDAEFVSANPYETDCKSFQFTKTGNYWQEAGVKKIKFKVYYRGLDGFKTWLDCEVNQVVVGLPSRFSSGVAANLAAKAVDYARKETYSYAASYGGTLTAAQAVQYFRTKLNNIVAEKGGTASVNGSGSPTIVFKDAESTFWTNPYDC